jgi:opacity protein-like surface antigen
MFKRVSSFLAMGLTLLVLNASLMADECCYPSSCNRLYIGGFGGELFSNKTRMIQRGTAFFSEAEGGPLAVDARGHSKSKSAGFGGIQIGYEWTQCPYYLGCSEWSITPAAEFEAYWYRHTNRGDLMNPSVRLPEHDFRDTFPMHVGIYMFNGVLALNNNCNNCFSNFTPYVGGGVGFAHLSIRNATSFQVSPPEAGIDHFNSDRSDSSFTFAAQAKVGLRYNICERFHIFGEYRFLFIDSSRYLLGSTMYPTHAPTSTWDIDIKHLCYNAFTFGLQYDL